MSMMLSPFSHPITCDPYFSSVRLLLSMDASTIIDASGYTSLSSTGSGSTQDTSVKQYGAASRRFAANGAVRQTGNAAYATGTGDFTFEMWVYLDSTTTGVDQHIAQTRDGTGNGWLIQHVQASGKLSAVSDTGLSGLITASAVSKDAWHHVALTRQGTTFRFFVDGVLEASTTSSQSLTANWIVLGSRYAVDGIQWYYLKGNLDEVRFTANIARYTAAFTPPSSAFLASQCASAGDPHWASVLMYLRFDSASGSEVPDLAGNGSGTLNGGAVISSATSVFGGASCLLDGSADFVVRVDSGGDASITSGDATVECWIRPAVNNAVKSIIAKRVQPIDGGWQMYMDASGKLGVIAWTGASTAVSLVGTTTVSTSTWHHVAFTKQGTTWRLFLNGVLEASGTQSTVPTSNVTNINIGRDASTTARDFNGHIDEVRLTMGVARYTAAFTVPTSQFPASA
jgi:hypothetical protein